MRFLLPLLVLAGFTGATPPPPSLPSYTFAEPYSGAVTGDSLKVVVLWTQTPDSAQFGKIDSTVYKLRSSKPAVFYGGTAFPANTDVRHVKDAVSFADSFKLARPAPGDSAVFQVKGFVQCRKGDCSVPGGAGFQYRSTFAPPAATVSGTKVTVF